MLYKIIMYTLAPSGAALKSLGLVIIISVFPLCVSDVDRHMALVQIPVDGEQCMSRQVLHTLTSTFMIQMEMLRKWTRLLGINRKQEEEVAQKKLGVSAKPTSQPR